MASDHIKNIKIFIKSLSGDIYPIDILSHQIDIQNGDKLKKYIKKQLQEYPEFSSLYPEQINLIRLNESWDMVRYPIESKEVILLYVNKGLSLNFYGPFQNSPLPIILPYDEEDNIILSEDELKRILKENYPKSIPSDLSFFRVVRSSGKSFRSPIINNEKLNVIIGDVEEVKPPEEEFQLFMEEARSLGMLDGIRARAKFNEKMMQLNHLFENNDIHEINEEKVREELNRELGEFDPNFSMSFIKLFLTYLPFNESDSILLENLRQGRDELSPELLEILEILEKNQMKSFKFGRKRSILPKRKSVRRKSIRKKSRSPKRKSVRKSRKNARKSRKSTRKSRKNARKSRKSVRKSRKGTRK
jgi:hypothetical protein